MSAVPYFMIGGVAAGGTGFLYELLIQHEEIYLPQERIPEPHYYYKSWEYQKGLAWYLNQYFSNVPNGKKAGDRSSSYLYGKEAVASKIAQDFPLMKFIFMLRNPVERAFANYRFTVLQGYEDLSFKEALEHEATRVAQAEGGWKEIAPHDYTGRGYYAKQLQAFLKYFPKDQILCVKSETLSNKNMEPLRDIYQFLDLKDQSFIPKPSPSYTSFSVVDAKLQKRLREYFGDRFAYMMNSIRREEEIEGITENDKAYYELLKNNLKLTKEEIPQDCKAMLRELFYHEILDLAPMVNFDVKSWLEDDATDVRGGQK